MSKSAIRYKTSPSDDEDWIIIELLDKKVKVDLHKEVLNFRYDCIPHPVIINGKEYCCSRFCCYAGCYISPKEIALIEEILPDLKAKYLPKDSVAILNKYNDEFYLPEDYDQEENLYKTRCAPIEPPDEYLTDEYEGEVDTFEDDIEHVPPSRCLFLMENGLCSLHKYLNDIGKDWTVDKFNICTTFPIDIRVTRNETAADAPYPMEKRVDDECSTIKLMEDYEEFLFHKMDCINLSCKMKEKKKMPYIIESMKYAIVTRFGEDMWRAIMDYAVQYRKELK